MAHTVYALIIKSEVVNLTVGELEEVERSAARIYGQSVMVVDVSRIPAWVGDSYDGSAFYRHGKIVEPLPDEEEV